MKQRNIALCIVFSVITCGIYGIYWFICVTDDVNQVSARYTTSGAMAFVLSLITCGIYGIYWAYKMGECLDEARMTHGEPSGSLAIIFLILNIFGLSIITLALAQNELNKYDIL